MTRRRPQRQGPLRTVVKVVRKRPGVFAQALVQLDCGHLVKSISQPGQRAHCDHPACRS